MAESNGNDRKYNDFLKPEHLARGINKLKPTGDVRELDGQFGKQILVSVELDGKVYDLAMKPTSPNVVRALKSSVKGVKVWEAETRPYTNKDGRKGEFIALL